MTHELQYLEVADQLEKKARKVNDELGDIAEKDRLMGLARQMREWIDKGMREPCPVDYKSEGIQFALPAREEMPSRSTTPVSTVPASSVELAQEMAAGPALENEPLPENGEPEEEEEPDNLDLRTIKGQFKEAKDNFEKNQWKEALSLGEIVQEKAKPYPTFEKVVSTFMEQVRRALQEEVDRLIAEGDQAKENGDTEKAEQCYNRAKEFAPENSEIIARLNALIGRREEEVNARKIVTMRYGLRSNDLQLLEDAIRDCETLDSNGLLPDELKDLLVEGRKRFDDMRQSDGKVTTMMHFGSLDARFKALQEIRGKVVKSNVKVIYDAALSKNRPAQEVLKEAEKLYFNASEDVAQYELDLIRKLKLLPAKADTAKDHLTKALKNPLHEEHKRALQEKLDEVNEIIRTQLEANALIKQAEAEKNLTDAFIKMREAQKLVPYREGIEEKVRRARQKALDDLAGKMRVFLDTARKHKAYDHYEDYDNARIQVNEALDIPKEWPEETKPQELLALSDEGNFLLQEITNRDTLHRDLDARLQAIRNQVANPHSRQAGLQAFAVLRSIQDFATFGELKNLERELDQYKNVFELLVEARQAREKGDWPRVNDLAQKILTGGTAGQFSAEAQDLSNEARLERSIERLRELLDQKQMEQADRAAKSILDRFPKASERIAAERQQIEDARKATSELEFFFTRANRLAQQRTLSDLIEALHMLRYLSGDRTEKGGPDWPEFRLSYFTMTCGTRAEKLASRIRDAYLKPVVEAVNNQEANLLKDPVQLRSLAEQARRLREAHLIKTDDENYVVRWLEIQQGTQDAHARESIDDWAGAVAVWKDRLIHYPDHEELKLGLRNARIQQVIKQSAEFINQGKPEQALSLLQQTEKEEGIGKDWRLSLSLADAYAALGSFQQAYRAVDDAAHRPDGKEPAEKKLDELKKYEVVRQTLVAVSAIVKNDRPRDALERIMSELKKPGMENNVELIYKRDQIFNEQKEKLLERIGAAGQDDAGKTQAVIALVDLQEYEKIIEIPEVKWVSTAKFTAFSGELSRVADAVLRQYYDFSVQGGLLSETLEKGGDILGRIKILLDITDRFKEQLSAKQKELTSAQTQLTSDLNVLKTLNQLLKESEFISLSKREDGHISPWDEAIINNNFGVLEQKQGQINQLGMGNMIEVQNFTLRLQEWEEVHQTLVKARAEALKEFKDENYERVLDKLRAITVQPSEREKGKLWRCVQPEDYQYIYTLFSRKVIWTDTYSSSPISGWQALENAAAERLAELKVWQEWSRAAEQKVKYVQTIEKNLNEKAPSLTVVDLKKERRDVLTAINETIDFIEGQVKKGCHSKKARDLSTRGEDEWLPALRNSRDQLFYDLSMTDANPERQLPTIEQLGEWVRLNQWTQVKQALDLIGQIGSTDPVYINKVKTYHVLYMNHQKKDKGNTDKRGFWDKIRGNR